ncbi:MAG: ParA family protein [Clostridium sp.]|nr:ParA family protein [Clostridium sp.]
MLITTLFNRKGGCGKSLLNQSVALHLATKEDKKVLLIDLDSQANLTSRIYTNEHNKPTVGDALVSDGELRLKDIIIKSPIKQYQNLDLIPSNENLKYLEEWLSNEDNSEMAIMDWLSEDDNLDIANSYDYIIWDLSPSNSIANRNALITCSNIIFINEYETRESISSIDTFINEYTEHCKDLDIDMCDFAIINNKFKPGRPDKTTLKALEEVEKHKHLHKYFIDTKISYSSVLRNSASEQLSVEDYSKVNFGSKNALKQMNELIEELKERELL